MNRPVKMLAMGNLELEHLKDGFTSLVSQAKPAILPAFLLWLDIKLSEYKVHGYMFSDPENQREGPWLRYALEVLCKYNPSLVSGLSLPENPSLQNGAATPQLPSTPTDSHIPAKKRSYLGHDQSQPTYPKMPEEIASMSLAYAVRPHKRKHQSSADSEDSVMDLSVSHLVQSIDRHHKHNGPSVVHNLPSNMGYHDASSDYGGSPSSHTQSPYSARSVSPSAQSSPSKISCRTPPKKRRDRATLHSTMRDLLTRPSSNSSPMSIIEKGVMKELFTQHQHPQPDPDMTNATVYTARSIMDESPLSLMKEAAIGSSTNSLKVPILQTKSEPQSSQSKQEYEDSLSISSSALTGQEVEQQFVEKAEKNVTSALRELLSAKLSLPPQDQDSCNTMLKSESTDQAEHLDQSVPSPTVPRDDHVMSSNEVLSDDSINRMSPDHTFESEQMQHLSPKSEGQLQNDKTMMDKFKTSGQQCKECGQIFHYRSSFRRHMKVHQGIFSHVCAVCGRKFTRKEHFVRHKCSRRPNKASRGAASQIENSKGTSPKVEYPPILDDDSYLPHGMDSPMSQHDSTLEDACYSEISVDFADSPSSLNGSKAPSLCGESRRKNKAPRRVIAMEDEDMGPEEFSMKTTDTKTSSRDHDIAEHEEMALGDSCSPRDPDHIEAEFGEDERGTANVEPFEEQPCRQDEIPIGEGDDVINQGDGSESDAQGGRMFTIDTGSYKVLTEDSTEASNKCIKVVKQGNYLRLKDEAQMIGGQLCFVCPVCKKIFHRSSNFSRHMRIHRGVYSYVCHTCNRGFFRKEHFQKHKCSRRGMSHISERKTKLEMDLDFPTNIDRASSPPESQSNEDSERETGIRSDEEFPPGAEEGIYLGDQNSEDANEEIFSDEDENRLTIDTDEAPSEL